MRKRVSKWRVVWTLFAVATTAGCGGSKPPPARPFAAPAVEATVRYFGGSALSGPTTRPVPVSTTPDALDVRVTFLSAEKPLDGGKPLDTLARLITGVTLDTPVLPAARPHQSAHIARNAASHRRANAGPSHSGLAAIRPRSVRRSSANRPASFANAAASRT